MSDAPLPAQPVPPVPQPAPQPCVLCYTPLRVEDRHGPQPSCAHVICDDCCRQSLTTHRAEVNSKCPLCPGGSYDEQAIRNFLTPSEFERYSAIQLNVVLSRMPDIRYCIRAGCQGVGFVPAACQANPGQGFNQPMCATVVCRDCDTTTCVGCRGEPHGLMSCAAYASWKEAGYKPHALLKAALKTIDAKACRQCGTWTERIEGCNMVVCTYCAFRYCWECLRSLEFGCSSYICQAPRAPAPRSRLPRPPRPAPLPVAAAPDLAPAPAAAAPAPVPAPAPIPVPVVYRRPRVRPPPRRRVMTEADELEIPAWERLATRPARGPVRERDTTERDTTVPKGQWAVVGKARKTQHPTPPVRRDRRQAV